MSASYPTTAWPAQWRKSPILTQQFVMHGSLAALASSIAFFNLVTLNPEKSVVGIDLPVMIKLGLTGLAGVVGTYGIVAIRRVRELLFSFPGLWLTLLVLSYSVSSITSLTPINSIGATVALGSILLFTTTAVAVMGPFKTVRAILIGVSFYIVASWLMYFAMPSIGVFTETLWHDQEFPRMSGMSHPNTLGQYCGLAIGLIVVLMAERRLTHGVWKLIFGLALVALVLAMSRASMAALLIALALIYRDRILKFLTPIGTTLIALVVTGSLLIASMNTDLTGFTSRILFPGLSKSGDIEEVTTLTGRTVIWKFAAQKISQRPWLGYGPATSKEVFVDHVEYTHNLWLNILFSCGIFGGITILALTFGRLLQTLIRPHRVVDFIVIFVMLNGLLENVIFAYLPAAPTMLFVVAVVWRINDYYDQNSRRALG